VDHTQHWYDQLANPGLPDSQICLLAGNERWTIRRKKLTVLQSLSAITIHLITFSPLWNQH